MDKSIKKLKATVIFLKFLIIVVVIFDLFLFFNALRPSTITGVMEPCKDYKMFNAHFTPYEGIQRGANVKALIEAVISNNVLNQDTLYMVIGIKYGENAYKDSNNNSTEMNDGILTSGITGFKQAANALKKEISTAGRYEISFEYDYENGGLINTVIITQIDK